MTFFTWWVTFDWIISRENLKNSADMQARRYGKKHKDVGLSSGDSVLLFTRGSKLKGLLGKFQKRFVALIWTMGSFAPDKTTKTQRDGDQPFSRLHNVQHIT